MVEIAAGNEEKHIRELIDSSYQRVKRLFVLAYDNTEGNNEVSDDSFKKCFLPRVKIENYNIKIDGKKIMISQLLTPLSNTMKPEKYWQDKVMITRLVACWISYFEKNYRLIAADLSKQKSLDADWRAIQQIIFTGKIKSALANTRAIIYYILEQLKETTL